MAEIISVYYRYAQAWNNISFALAYTINIVKFWFLNTVFTQKGD